MTETIKIDRETMIDELTGSMMDAVTQDDWYLSSIITNGFTGFNNYTDAELIQEYRDYISEDPNAEIQIVLEKP